MNKFNETLNKLTEKKSAKDDADKLLKDIWKKMKELHSMIPSNASDIEDTDWSIVGDLGKVQKDLTELVKFLK